jgi:hypothetical protein
MAVNKTGVKAGVKKAPAKKPAVGKTAVKKAPQRKGGDPKPGGDIVKPS